MARFFSEYRRNLVVFGLLCAAFVVWFFESRSSRLGTTPTVQAPLSSDPSDPSVALGTRLEEARIEAEANPKRQDATEPKPVGWPPGPSLDANVPRLRDRLADFDRGVTFQSAQGLLCECIVFEMDAAKRFEDVTEKFDMIDPTNGHKLRKVPPHDPEVGFIDRLDPRGTRWYRFTRADFPEWWELHYPAAGSVTGTQDGLLAPTRVSPELASVIRGRAAELLRQFGEH